MMRIVYDRGMAEPLPESRPFMRGIWLVLGLIATAAGLIGAVLPLLPTTPFLILAAACFARSNERLNRWLRDHPQFGPMIAEWEAHRVIPPRAKLISSTAMAGSLAWMIWGVGVSTIAWVSAGVVLGACAAYVLTRPSHPPV